MISWTMAMALHDSGLIWRPVPGDRFRLLSFGPGGDIYTVSEMTIETHVFDTGVILGFNGTTEWALDSVAIEETLWHPLEHQLRELIGPAFRSLAATGDDGPAFRVEAELTGGRAAFTDPVPDDAYAKALLALSPWAPPGTRR